LSINHEKSRFIHSAGCGLAPAAAGTPHAGPGDLIVNAGVLYGWYGFGPSAASGISFFLNPRLAADADVFVPYYLGLGVGYSGILGLKLRL